MITHSDEVNNPNNKQVNKLPKFDVFGSLAKYKEEQAKKAKPVFKNVLKGRPQVNKEVAVVVEPAKEVFKTKELIQFGAEQIWVNREIPLPLDLDKWWYGERIFNPPIPVELFIEAEALLKKEAKTKELEQWKPLLDLFPYRYSPIYGDGDTITGCNVEWKTLRKKVSDEELIKFIKTPDKFIGLRPGNKTKVAVIDIDADSVYHNAESRFKIEEILETIGVNKITWYQSSASEGWHGYIILSQEVNTYRLASLLKQTLLYNDIEEKQGTLEIFPNCRAFNSQYNAFRMPLQAGFSYIDDYTFSPISIEAFCEEIQEAIEVNNIDENLLEENYNIFKRAKKTKARLSKQEHNNPGKSLA